MIPSMRTTSTLPTKTTSPCVTQPVRIPAASAPHDYNSGLATQMENTDQSPAPSIAGCAGKLLFFLGAALASAGAAPGSPSDGERTRGWGVSIETFGVLPGVVPKRRVHTLNSGGVVRSGAAPTVERFSILSNPSQSYSGLCLPDGERSTVGYPTEDMVAGGKANGSRPRKAIPMPATDRMTAPLVEMAACLHRELRRRHPEEADLWGMSGELASATDRVDDWFGVILAGCRVDGVEAENFNRKLREHRRDFADKETAKSR